MSRRGFLSVPLSPASPSLSHVSEVTPGHFLSLGKCGGSSRSPPFLSHLALCTQAMERIKIQPRLHPHTALHAPIPVRALSSLSGSPRWLPGPCFCPGLPSVYSPHPARVATFHHESECDSTAQLPHAHPSEKTQTPHSWLLGPEPQARQPHCDSWDRTPSPSHSPSHTACCSLNTPECLHLLFPLPGTASPRDPPGSGLSPRHPW